VDTVNFLLRLRAALLQDPDVILVGEMRDLETIPTALLAQRPPPWSSTLHTLDAAETSGHHRRFSAPRAKTDSLAKLRCTLQGVIIQRLVRPRL